MAKEGRDGMEDVEEDGKMVEMGGGDSKSVLGSVDGEEGGRGGRDIRLNRKSTGGRLKIMKRSRSRRKKAVNMFRLVGGVMVKKAKEDKRFKAHMTTLLDITEQTQGGGGDGTPNQHCKGGEGSKDGRGR